MKKLLLLFVALLSVGMNGAWATVSFDSNKYYYIVEATTQRYVSSSAPDKEGIFGLQSIGKMGDKFLFTEVSSGVFLISNTNGVKLGATHAWNTTNADTEWTIEEVENEPNVYTLGRYDGANLKYLNYQTGHPNSIYTDRGSKTEDANNKVKFYISEGLLPANKFVSVSTTKTNTFTASSGGTNYWYVVTQAKGGESPMYDDATNQRIMRAGTSTEVSGSTLDNDKYLVRFVATGTGDSYYVQFATGDYVYSPNSTTQSDPLKSSNTNATMFMVYNINSADTHIGWNVTADGSTYGKRIDNNGAGNAVLIYDDGQINYLDGNNDWSLYPVSFVDPVNVTYQVTFGGNVVASTNRYQYSGSAADATPVAVLQNNYVNFSAPDYATVSEEHKVITYTATLKDGFPFTYSTNYEDATWYYWKLNGNYVSYADAAPYPASTTKPSGDNLEKGLWAFIGNPYKTRIINKTAGDTKFMQANSYPEMTTTATDWVVANNTRKNSLDYFTVHSGANNYMNLQSSTLRYWNSTDGATDNGSTFTIEEYSEEYAGDVATYITPYFDTHGSYFSITDAAYSANETTWTTAKTTCNKTTFDALYAVVSNSSNIVWPGSGYYLLKNNSLGTYLNTTTAPMLSATNNAATSIIYLTKNDDGTYYIQSQGLYLQSPTSGGATRGETPVKFTPTIGAATKVSFTAAGGSTSGYENLSGSGSNVKGFPARGIGTDPQSYWIVENISSFTGSLTNAIDNTSAEHSYATLCVPFAISTLSGANAYMPTVSGEYVVPGDAATVSDGTLIPAGTPVILVGAKDAGTYTATIKSETAPVTTPATTNVLTGTFAGTSIDCTSSSTNYVLGFDQDNGNRIGFYHVSGGSSFALNANRAYLNTDNIQGVKGFAINFDEADGLNEVKGIDVDGVIYNLAGQRLSQPQKGVNIINGKKVIVK